MAAGAHSVGGNKARTGDGTARDGRGRTPAQWYCLLAGAALLLAGLFGFLADATFDTSATVDPEGGNTNGQLQGDSFLGFEVNGWHNVVHLLSGLVLLAAFPKRASAKTVALAFGLVYGVVTIIGLIDGNDVLGLIPVNGADNVLHILLSLLGIAAALASRGRDDGRDLETSTSGGYPATGRRVDSSDLVRGTSEREGDSRVGRFDRDGRELTPEDHDQTTGGRRTL